MFPLGPTYQAHPYVQPFNYFREQGDDFTMNLPTAMMAPPIFLETQNHIQQHLRGQ